MKFDKYRTKLLAKQQELLADLNRVALSGRERQEPGELDLVDESVSSERRESWFAQAERDTKLLNENRDALRRIAEGTYGRCLEDGERIPEERLKAVPWTRYCVKHQNSYDITAEDRQPTL